MVVISGGVAVVVGGWLIASGWLTVVDFVGVKWSLMSMVWLLVLVLVHGVRVWLSVLQVDLQVVFARSV